MRIAATLFLAVAPQGVDAQQVSSCDGWVVSAANIAEPWEANTRTFANGDVRIALLDTVEPAAAAFHLMVLSLPYDELGIRQCRIVSAEGGQGFYVLSLEGLTADYHPELGLAVELPLRFYGETAPELAQGALIVTINQATGEITAEALGT